MPQPATWVTEPPITVYTKKDWCDCRRLARTLKRNIEKYTPNLTASEMANALQSTALNECKDLKIDTKDSITMCDEIHTAVDHSKFLDVHVFLAYMFCGNPLGLMLFKPTYNPPYVDDIVFHPGAPGGGPILIEYALNYLRKNRMKEQLKLWALNENCVGPYLGMGFVSVTEKQDMLLDPLQSKKWDQPDGRWRYTSASHPGTKYASQNP